MIKKYITQNTFLWLAIIILGALQVQNIRDILLLDKNIRHVQYEAVFGMNHRDICHILNGLEYLEERLDSNKIEAHYYYKKGFPFRDTPPEEENLTNWFVKHCVLNPLPKE